MDTKRFLALSAFYALFTSAAGAQGFSSLWKKVEQAGEKGHPKTQIEILKNISDKAEASRSYGDLLKAEVKTLQLWGDISADSVRPKLQLLAQKALAVEKTDTVLSAVYCAVVGKSIKAFGKTITSNSLDDSDDYVVGTSSEGVFTLTDATPWFRHAMKNPSALAAIETDSYEPLIVNGADSRYFLDDLLHVVGMEADDYRSLYEYYNARGNREAACLCAMELLRKSYNSDGAASSLSYKAKKSKYLQQIDSLINVYGDLPVAGELAIEHYNCISSADDVDPEDQMNYLNYALMKWGDWKRMNVLRNAKTNLTMPNFHLTIGSETMRPNEKRDVVITSICNIEKLTMKVYKFKPGVTSYDVEVAQDNIDDQSYFTKKIKSQLLTEPVLVRHKRYVGLPAYKLTRDTMTIDSLGLGAYVVEFTTDLKTIKAERAVLKVSDLRVLSLKLPDNKTRVVTLNTTTGQPVKNAKIEISYTTKSSAKVTKETIVCDVNGETIMTCDDRRGMKVRPYTNDDIFATNYWLSNSYYFRKNNKTNERCSLFTDRKIYRPGQTVNVAALAFISDKGKDFSVCSGKEFDLTLFDANYKQIEKKTVVTDNYGMASTEFTLPTSGLTGNFHIRMTAANEKSQKGSVYFSVEEYKRPTFKVEFNKIDKVYAEGDTLKLGATAKTFAGVAVQNAKVAYSVTRRKALYWRWNSNNGTERMAADTVMTDGDGRFVLPVVLTIPDEKDSKEAYYYTFDVTAAVTNGGGETREGSISVPLSNRKSILSLSLPSRIERGDSVKATVHYKNIAGIDIAAEALLTVKVKDGVENIRSEEMATNTARNFCVTDLPSAEYEAMAVVEGDTVRQSFVVFGLNDKQTPIKTHDWFYQKGDKFALDGTPVYVQVGSSDAQQHIVYSVFADGKVIDSGFLDLHNEINTHKFEYKEEYGDGLFVTYAWAKDGEVYTHNSSIVREMPSKKLSLEWKTFRDKLTPGQKEQWTLSIKTPEGKPAKAQLLSVMYDMSLDEIRQHNWNFNVSPQLTTPYTRWRANTRSDRITLYGEQRYTPLNEPSLSYSHFDDGIFGFNYGELLCAKEISTALSGRASGVRLIGAAMTMSAKEESYDEVDESPVVKYDTENKESATTSSYQADDGTDENGVVSSKAEVRENLNETAFFYPSLIADKNGDVHINFTLPESVTTWRFMALAHDSLMNNGMISAEAEAKKIVMIQPNVPRFMRSGDKGMMNAVISNTSEKKVSGTATMELTDPESGKSIYVRRCKFSVEAGQTQTVAFDIDASMLPTLSVITFRAEGKGFSDGEQHYLPILPDKELVTNTLPFTLDTQGKHTFDVGRLIATNNANSKLTIEYTAAPEWLVVQALPSMATPDGDNAISMAASYYANALGKYILSAQPQLKNVIEKWNSEDEGSSTLQSMLERNQELKSIVLDETPWVGSADKEADQKRQLANFFDEAQMYYRMHTQIVKLRKLQTSDGGFSWWSGMPASKHVTNTVLGMLARLKTMTTATTAEYSDIMNKAFSFMDKQIAKEVSEMKKYEKESGKDHLRPSELATNYLYICALTGRQLKGTAAANQSYLISRMKDRTNEMTIYGKANAAVILAKHTLAGDDGMALANDYLQSLKEYSVSTPEMGRYFDTHRADYSWCDYRIPSQVAAIEALQNVSPDDSTTIGEMQRWLLQEKRTTAWSTPINSVNAVYAFMNGGKRTMATANGGSAKISVNGKRVETPNESTAIGYIKTAVTGKDISSLTIEKLTSGMSWGAIYGQSLQKTTDVEASSAGLSVKRELLVNGKKTQKLHIGDRVTVRITVVADRDYDFVQIADKRAACMEPATQLSGYRNGFYCSPKDNATYYYIYMLPKGRRVIEADYYIDRTGTYDTGTCTVQCAYAPEYSARSTATSIVVE